MSPSKFPGEVDDYDAVSRMKDLTGEYCHPIDAEMFLDKAEWAEAQGIRQKEVRIIDNGKAVLVLKIPAMYEQQTRDRVRAVGFKDVIVESIA